MFEKKWEEMSSASQMSDEIPTSKSSILEFHQGVVSMLQLSTLSTDGHTSVLYFKNLVRTSTLRSSMVRASTVRVYTVQA